MENRVGGTNVAGKKLKAISTLWTTNTGTDNYGFSALPSGMVFGGISFTSAGTFGFWWTTKDYGSYYAYHRYISSNYDYTYSSNTSKISGMAVRCIQD